MLDENLPTFRLKPSPDNPSTSILFLSQHGSDPSPEYLFRRADPATHPSSRGKYAAALCSPNSAASVVYAEVLVSPEWTQPTLSAAEIRASGGATPPPVPVTPDSFAVQLYDPDQGVTVRMLPGSWGKSDSWEFEMPTQSFAMPSASALDREERERRASSPDGVVAGLAVPRIVFRWKRDGRLSKDMTCYLVGKNLGGGKKSKEPDITVAMFKAGKESAVTIYEPNLRRVEVEDRKGLEVVLLLGAEVIRDLYLVPRQDVFNVGAGVAQAVNGGRRKNSRPSPSPPAAMSGALGNVPAAAAAAVPAARPTTGPSAPSASGTAGIDAETRRLQEMVAREEQERERREKAEQMRIKKMLEEEERERRRREAEVARETERLKKLYGVQGQDLRSPQLPPRPMQQQPNALYPPQQGGGAWYGRGGGPPPHLPPRPVSVGPVPQQGPGPYASGALNSWWRGPGASGPPPQQQQQQYSGGTRRSGSGGTGSGLGILNPAAAASGFFGGGREDREKKKVQKKRSMHW